MCSSFYFIDLGKEEASSWKKLRFSCILKPAVVEFIYIVLFDRTLNEIENQKAEKSCSKNEGGYPPSWLWMPGKVDEMT